MLFSIGYALLAASTSQQVAHELDGHGVFSHYVLRGLGGDAGSKPDLVTVNDLTSYVLDNMRRWNAVQGLRQEPTSHVEGMGDMILADRRPSSSS